MSAPSRAGLLGGVLAGVAGTAAYTVVSAAVRRRTGSSTDTQPAEVATAITGSAWAGRRGLNAALHWGYGACGGLARAGLVRAGLSGWKLNLAHLAVVWLPWRALLALSGKGKPAGGLLLVDGGKHLVYVLGTGATLRLLSSGRGELRW